MPRLRIQLHRGYGLLVLIFTGVIGWLSSRPDLGGGEANPLVRLASNLLHIPLYAGLTFCFVKAVRIERDGHHAPWPIIAFTALAMAALAVLDEWSQSFVPGRQASLGDFFLDLAGILGMILLLRLPARRRRSSRATADNCVEGGGAL